LNAKRKGSRNEHRSIAILEAAGYRCTRSATSLGEWDIIAIGSTDMVVVQVKTRDWPGSAEMETLSYSQRRQTAGSLSIAGGIGRACRM